MINNSSRAHICQCLIRLSTFRRHSIVTIDGEQSKTGEQFVESVLKLSHHLCELGLRPGDIVGICAFNSDSYLEWMLAVTYVGGIIAHLNYRWSVDELKVALEMIRPIILVADNSCTWSLELQNCTMVSMRWHVSLDSYASTSKRVENATNECQPLSIKYNWAPQDAAMICFTSGSTGRPKGVIISHTSLLMQSLAKLSIVGYTQNDVYIHTASLCHIGGISSCMAMLMVGGCHVLIPKFVAERAIDVIRKNHVTSFIVVPAMLADLVSAIRQKQELSVKKILNGGGNLSVQLIRDTIKHFPRAKLLSAYGLTETCSSLTFNTLYDPTDKHLEQLESIDKTNLNVGICVGNPAPHVEILVKREGSSLVGNIMTRGPHVMVRYWGQITTTIPDTYEDWFATGDIGRFDDIGNLWLIGRRNGRIKSGGENVYPEEVEAILLRHPGISSVVVTGIPHERLGEMIIACVQIRRNWIWPDRVNESLGSTNHLANEALKSYCRHKCLTSLVCSTLKTYWASMLNSKISKLSFVTILNFNFMFVGLRFPKFSLFGKSLSQSQAREN